MLAAGALVGLLPLAFGLVPGDEATRLERLIVGYGLAGLPFLLVWRGWRALPDRLAPLLAVAVGIRLLLLLLPPLLSEDVWRYVWDGAMQLAGQNPYALAPLDPALDALAADPTLAAVRAAIGHGHIPTIYPPMAQAFFAGAGLLGPAPIWIRLGLVAADAGAIAALWALARRAGRPPQAVALLAFAPPAVLEGAVGAHVDALGVACLALALGLLGRRRLLAGVALGASVATKLLPLMAWPVLLRRGRGPLLAAVATVGLVALPYLAAGPALVQGLGAYGARWRANDGFFALLIEGFQRIWPPAGVAVELPAWAARLARTLVGPSGGPDPLEIWPDELAFAAAKVVALGLFGLVWLLLAARAWRAPDATSALATLLGPATGALLLLSPVVHPWYLLWVLPLVVHAAGRRWTWPFLAWQATVFLAYLPRPDYLRGLGWEAAPAAVWLQYAPVWFVLAMAAWPGVQRGRPG
ncbi:MAG: glycosyltransferase 87 family protein [bacterium]